MGSMKKYYYKFMLYDLPWNESSPPSTVIIWLDIERNNLFAPTLVGCCVLPLNGGHLRPPCIFLLICPSFKSSPKTMGRRPPIHDSNPHTSHHQVPPHHCRRLLVGCCELLLNGGHLRPIHHVHLYFFYVALFLPPNRRTSRRAAKPSHGRLVWDHRDRRNQDQRLWRLLPWR